jgi:PII-like signaling protein
LLFERFMGYAPHADIATAGILRLAENLPVVVDIVDSEERIEEFLPFPDVGAAKNDGRQKVLWPHERLTKEASA